MKKKQIFFWKYNNHIGLASIFQSLVYCCSYSHFSNKFIYRVCFCVQCECISRIKNTRTCCRRPISPLLRLFIGIYYFIIIFIFWKLGLINKKKENSTHLLCNVCLFSFICCFCECWISDERNSAVSVWENFRTFFFTLFFYPIHIHTRNKCLKCVLYKIFRKWIKKYRAKLADKQQANSAKKLNNTQWENSN